LIPQPEIKQDDILLSTIRHGLTELNRSKRTGGRTDAPLIPEGRAQAAEAHTTFDGTPFDAAYASSLSRAIETAWIVAGSAPPELIVDDLCIVRSMTTEQINHDPAHTFMNTGTTISARCALGRARSSFSTTSFVSTGCIRRSR